MTLVRGVLLVALLGVGGCPGSKSSSGTGTVEEAKPTAAACSFVIDDNEMAEGISTWSITMPGATLTMEGLNRTFTSGKLAVSVHLWDGDTSLESVKEQIPEDASILHERGVEGASLLEIVVQTDDLIGGHVLIEGSQAPAICGFELEAGDDWQAALASCASLREDADAPACATGD